MAEKVLKVFVRKRRLQKLSTNAKIYPEGGGSTSSTPVGKKVLISPIYLLREVQRYTAAPPDSACDRDKRTPV